MTLQVSALRIQRFLCIFEFHMHCMRRILLILIFIILPASFFSQNIRFSLPRPNQTQINHDMYFEWDYDDLALYYTLSLTDGNANLTNYTVYQQDTVLNLPYQDYWATITPVYTSGNGIPSTIVPFSIFDFLGTNPKLWLPADSSLDYDSGNLIDTWYDMSGNGNHATQTYPAYQPLFSANESILNNHPTVKFDGTDVLNTPNLNQSDVEIYALLKGNYVNNEFFHIGNGYHFNFVNSRPILYLENNNYRYFQGLQPTGIYQIHNLSWLNGSADASSTFLSVNQQPLGYSTSVSGSGYITNNLKIGSGTLNGEIAELIVYNTQQTNENRDRIHNYLRTKYAPPVNLGPNPPTYSLCSKTLSAGTRFTSFYWSTGEVTESITVTESGTYWVQVTDIFGFASYDSITIQFPIINQPAQTLYCPGDSLIWQTNLGSDYTHLWNTSATTDSIVIKNPGYYFVKVTDSLGCYRHSDTLFFHADPFSSNVSLGPDANLCKGNILSLVSGADEAVSYQWNTGDTTSDIALDTSGLYTVLVTNINGCIASDSVQITIVGIAPFVQIGLTSPFCLQENLPFIDQSYTTDGSNINGWLWDMGDTTTYAVSSGTHIFQHAGQYTVTLTVQTDAGCSNTTETSLVVSPKPNINFTTQNSCAKNSIQFHGVDLSLSYPIVDWQWNFGDPGSGVDNTAMGEDVAHSFNVGGNYLVTLSVEDSYGCHGYKTNNITIKPSGTAQFTYNKACLNDPILFTNTSFAGFPINITGYKWHFNNPANDSSAIVNPTFTYTQLGDYPVQLAVYTDNGCVSTYTDTIHINKYVDAAITVPNDTLCRGAQYLLLDNSNYINTSANAWQWSVNGQNIGTENPQTAAFSSSGWRTIRLITTSSDFCTDSAKTLVFIKQPPTVSFSLSPLVGAPPLTCTMNYTGSPSANQFHWDLGDGDDANGVSVSHTYMQSGLFTITLYATDPNGCTDSAFRVVNVITPVFQIDLSNLTCIEQNGYIRFNADIQNLSTVTITSMDIESWISGTQPALETWMGNLYIGNTLHYESAYQIQMIDDAPLCCMRIGTATGILNDTVFNKTICVPLKNEFRVLPPFPNPSIDESSINIIAPLTGEAFITVSNMRGEVVSEQSLILHPGVNTVSINTIFYTAGIFQVAVYYKDERQQVRLMVIHH